MSLLSRALMWIPRVRRLEEERDALRGERDSMRLRVRAISAKMGVLEEQGRVLAGERDRCAEQARTQAAEHGRLSAQLRAVLEARDAVAAERDQLARDLDQLRQGPSATMPAIAPPLPATEGASARDR